MSLLKIGSSVLLWAAWERMHASRVSEHSALPTPLPLSLQFFLYPHSCHSLFIAPGSKKFLSLVTIQGIWNIDGELRWTECPGVQVSQWCNDPSIQVWVASLGISSQLGIKDRNLIKAMERLPGQELTLNSGIISVEPFLRGCIEYPVHCKEEHDRHGPRGRDGSEET